MVKSFDFSLQATTKYFIDAYSQQVQGVKSCRVELYDIINMLCLNGKGYTTHETWSEFCKMKD